MPELPEVEQYRALLALHGLGRVVASVDADDPWYMKGGIDAATVRVALTGRALVGARRIGKLLLVDTGPATRRGDGQHQPPSRHATHHTASDRTDANGSDRGGPVLGLRFGMSGRLLIDGHTAIDRLLYAPVATEPRWDRFVVHFADGGELRMQDPRRLGGVEIDPDESRLGPDALGASLDDVRAACRGARVAIKARLLDQSKIAGIGNLAGDEILWRARLSPLRPAGDLDERELRRLHRRIGSTLRLLIRRGGSHTGDLIPARHPGGVCPDDGEPLRRATVGGRTTWWCPAHQR